MRLSEVPREALVAALAAKTLCGQTIMRLDDGVVDYERTHLHHCTELQGHRGQHTDGERTWE